MPKWINIRKRGFPEHYGQWRIQHPDAVPLDKLVNYYIHGDEFGDPLTIPRWVKVTKASSSTVLKWLPLIKDYVHNEGILNESVADAIVKTNQQKQKGNT